MLFQRKRPTCILLLLILLYSITLSLGIRQSSDLSGGKRCCPRCCKSDNGSKESHLKGTREINDNMGSKPPSCLNKCQSCTPCQLVKAVRVTTTKIGSRPPNCNNKCNACVPCHAVQTPTDVAEVAEESSNSESTVGYSNYMPEAWKCQCGDQFFNP